jgi:tRNA A37 threonylcarbamoyltransferase TsaD
VGDYAMLARLIDDAAGEAFDKSAKLMGLGCPVAPLTRLWPAKVAMRRKPYALPQLATNLDFSPSRV